MAAAIPPASTSSKPPSTSSHHNPSPSRPTLSSATSSHPAAPFHTNDGGGSSYLRAPTPSAISISSTSVAALDDEAEPTTAAATTAVHPIPNESPRPLLLPPDYHPRVVSSSSSAAAGGPDTDTDIDRAPTHPHDAHHHDDVASAPHPTDHDGPPAAKKPKSKAAKRPRVTSPSPPPPPRPPPRLTIRLDIQLGGPSDYEVNVLQLAKQTGQRPPTPPPPPRSDDTDSSSDEGDGKPKRRMVVAEYDYDDPFIDDSDLRIDAPTHFAQTKQQGFYVSSGDVALVKDKTPRKVRPPKSAPGGGASTGGALAPDGRKREVRSLTSLLMNATAVAEAPTKVVPMTQVPGQEPPSRQFSPPEGAGTRDSPIALFDDEDRSERKPPRSPLDGSLPPAKKMKTDEGRPVLQAEYMAIGPSDMMLSSGPNGDAVGNGKKRKISKESLEKIFHPTVNKALRELKVSIDQADWSARGKFPPQLKPLVQQTAVVALQHGDYNDNFFDYLPTIFPYNRFTMMKLTSRLMYHEHQKFLSARQDALLDELRQIATEDFPKAQEEFARACVAWEERQKRKMAEKVNESGSTAEGGLTPANAMDIDGPSRPPSPAALAAAAESDVPGTGKEGGKEKIPGTREREDKAPTQKYKWTDAIKSRVWGLVHLSNESARLTGVMHGWDATVPIATEQSLRKSLYARITAVFPEGWMNSQAISREVSNMKLKLKKESVAAAPKVEKFDD